VGGRLHGFNECLARRATFETAELLGRNDDHLVASMHGDVLRSLASYLTDEFAEARLGVLQKPVARTSLRGAGLRLCASID
jgi:hypothetical protein